MKSFPLHIALFLLLVFGFPVLSTAGNGEEQFDTDKILTDLEEELKISSDKLEKLKPSIDEKSKGLQKSIAENVDKGFVHFEEFKSSLETVSKDIEKDVKNFLSSDEYVKFKQYLEKIDKEAIENAKNKIIEDLTELLALTEAQVEKLKPILEDSVNKLNSAFDTLAKEGGKSWSQMKDYYQRYTEELRSKLKDILDKDQMKKFDEYQNKKKSAVRESVIEV